MKTFQSIALTLLVSLSFASLAQERGRSFSPNFKGYYYLRTEFTGDKLSLESNGASSSTMNGASFMSSRLASGTQWKFVPDTKNKGWYRLKTADQGENKCLEANVNGRVKGGAVFMDNCMDVTGQLWRLDLVTVNNGDHLYRLRSQSGGNAYSLEGHRPDIKHVKSGNTYMDKTQNVTGQFWRLVVLE